MPWRSRWSERDVREDARLVRLVAHAAQHEPAAGGLEDGDVDVGPRRGSATPRRARSSRPARPSARRRGRRRTSSSRRAARPATRMWVDQPGDRALAVRAGDRDDRHPPVGVADPGRRRRPRRRRSRASQRSTQPRLRAGRGAHAAPATTSRSVKRERRLGDRLRPLRAGPRERHDPVARVRRAVDGDAAAALAAVGPQPPDPVGERRDPSRPVAAAGPRAQPDERVAPGLALAVPGPPPADGDLDLDHRLQPVDVRSFEQADLDQAHGPARIATSARRRWTALVRP